MSLRVYLDLDRTLYRTDLGGELIWQKVAELYPQVGLDQHQEQQNFYVFDGDSYAYDFSAHLASIGLDRDSVYRELRQSELADGRLEYEGAEELVQWIRSVGRVAVLTYGVDDYQRLKAALCPSLHDVDVITTLEPKGDFLRKVDLNGSAWMVDDKSIGDELPENVRFIQTLVDDAVSQGQGGVTWPVAYSLEEVLTVLQNQ